MSISPSPRLRRITHLLGSNGRKPAVSLAGQPRAEPVTTEPPVGRKKGRPPQATVPDDLPDWGRIEPEILDGSCSAAD